MIMAFVLALLDTRGHSALKKRAAKFSAVPMEESVRPWEMTTTADVKLAIWETGVRRKCPKSVCLIVKTEAHANSVSNFLLPSVWLADAVQITEESVVLRHSEITPRREEVTLC